MGGQNFRRMRCAQFWVVLIVCSTWIGISQSVLAAVFLVTSPLDETDVQPGDAICATGQGICTLRAAIQESNALAGQDEITLPAGSYQLLLVGLREDQAAQGDLDLRDDTVITGENPESTMIDAGKIDRVFDIFKVDNRIITIHLIGITIRGGQVDYTNSDGGCIFNEGNLTIQNTVLTNCRAAAPDGSGGAIFNAGGHLTLTDTLLTDSYAAMGGAIASTGVVDVFRSTVRQNAAIQGGGLFLQAGEVYLNEVEVDQNRSSRHGAGIHIGNHGVGNVAVSASILNSRITNNQMEAGQVTGQSDPQGAGIFVMAQSNLYIENSTIRGNRGADQCFVCRVSGGGIYNENGVVVLNKVTVSDNHAALWGGGIYNFIEGTLSIVGSTITDNRAGEFGGGIASEFHTASHDVASVSNSVISGNQAAAGGALAGSFSLNNVTIADNLARGAIHPVTKQPAGGGGLFVPGSSYLVHLEHVTFAGNSTAGNAAEIDNGHGGAVTIGGSIIGLPGVPVTQCSGPIRSQGNNIFGDDSCQADNNIGDRIADAALGSLQNNGGPTATRLPLAGSPAIDVIANPCPTVDQRYFFRGLNACDVGAVEANSDPARAGRFVFAGSSDVTWREGSGPQQISVERVDGNQGAVAVDVIIHPETTTRNEDFTSDALIQTLAWSHDESGAKSISITPLADNKSESEEILVVELRNATPNVTIDRREMTARISDIDASAPPMIGNESGGGWVSAWLIGLLSAAARSSRSRKVKKLTC